MAEPWILWDLGGVRVNFIVDHFYEEIARLFQVPVSEVVHFLDSSDGEWRSFELRMSAEEICNTFNLRFGKRVSLAELEKAFNNCYEQEVFDRHLASVDKLLEEYGVMQGVISNLNPIHAEYIERKFRHLFRNIHPDLIFYSCRIGMRKECGSSIFEHVFQKAKQRFDLKRKDAIFIEDNKENLRCFIEAGGGNALRFDGSFHRLTHHLKNLGVFGQIEN